MFNGKSPSGTEFSLTREGEKYFAAIPVHGITRMAVTPGTSASPQGPVEGLKGQAKVKGKYTPVYLPWYPELRAWFAEQQEEFQAEEAAARKEAEDVPWPTFVFRLGCDSDNTCQAETYPELLRYRPDWQEAAEVLRNLGDRLAKLAPTAEKLPGDLGSWYSLRISGADAEALWLRNHQNKTSAQAEKTRKSQEREVQREKNFVEARATGKAVLLHRWTEGCNDPREECDLDNLEEWVHPDGTTKITRIHTW